MSSMCPVQHDAQFQSVWKIQLSFSSSLMTIFWQLRMCLHFQRPKICFKALAWHHLTSPVFWSSVRLCGAQLQGSFVTWRRSFRIERIAAAFTSKISLIWLSLLNIFLCNKRSYPPCLLSVLQFDTSLLEFLVSPMTQDMTRGCVYYYV